MAYYISYSLYDRLKMDNRRKSRANTCEKAQRKLRCIYQILTFGES